jgi:hypothetical protein
MLSQIDYYQPSQPSLEETYSMEADMVEALEAEEISKGQWDVITAPFMQNLLASGKSKAYWEGFIAELVNRSGVELAVFPQHHLIADEF